MEINKIINSPVDGKVKKLKDVNDGVFSELMLGDGVAVFPIENKFYAPISGKLITLFPTGHAFGIRNEDEIEILVHIGIDTVDIEDKVFDAYCKQGQDVKQGDLIIKADLDKIESLGYSKYTMVIATSKEPIQSSTMINKDVKHGDGIFTLDIR